MNEEPRPAAAPAPGSARKSLAERIGARHGLIDPKFAQKFLKPRRFQTWQKAGGLALTRAGRSGSSLYQDFVGRYQPPAARIRRRFNPPAAAAEKWKPLDLALPVGVPAAPVQGARPEVMTAPGLPSLAVLSGGLPLPQRPAQPQGQIIPRKENDPDYAPNKAGKRAPAPVKPKLTPNQKLFTRVEEVIPGRPAASEPEATEPELPPNAAPAPKETPQPAPAPQSARPSVRSATVQREPIAPERPRPQRSQPVPVQPAPPPPAPAVRTAPPAVRSPVESDVEKPAVEDRPAPELPVQLPLAEPKPAPARMAARPAEVQREVEPPAPRRSPQAMPAAPARQPARLPADRAPVETPANASAAAPADRPLARMAARPAAAVAAPPPASQSTGVVQREFVPAVRPHGSNAAPRPLLGRQRKWLAARKPKTLADRPRPRISLMARPPLPKPTANAAPPKPSAHRPAVNNAAVYRADPESLEATPPANLPVAKAPSPYAAFPDESMTVAPPASLPSASRPAVYLDNPDLPSPRPPAREPLARPLASEKPAPPVSSSSVYQAPPDSELPEPRPRIPTAYTAFNSEPEAPASAPYASLAFHGMEMPMAQTRPASPAAQTPAARSALFERPLLPQQPGGQPQDGQAAEYVVPPEFQERAVERQPAPLPDSAALPEGYTDGNHDLPPSPSIPEGYTDGNHDRPPMFEGYSDGNHDQPPPAPPIPQPSPEPAQIPALPDLPPSVAVGEPPEQPQPPSAATAQAQATGDAEQSLNFDQIARQVYPIILRRLRVERERNPGRHR